jgi:hypothetical protein
MTLIVARITDSRDGRISLLADTKITYSNGDETANRQVLGRPGQKVVILNDDVAVGFAGDNPDTALRHVVGLRGRGFTRSDLLGNLTSFSGASAHASRSFLVVERFPVPRLWQIINGRFEERTDVRLSYVGDTDAYNRFRSRTLEWGESSGTEEMGFVGSMQSVVTMDDLPTVGGYVVRVTGDRTTPFRFRGDPGMVAPWLTNAIVAKGEDKIHIRFETPPGGDSTEHARVDIAGDGKTFSALVHAIPQSGFAWMHTHEEPWADPIKIRAKSLADLTSDAARHGQQLKPPESEIVKHIFSD